MSCRSASVLIASLTGSFSSGRAPADEARALTGGMGPASAPRRAGAVAGFWGQPAVLQAADARVADERIEAAYATMFAFAIIVKIFLIPFIWTL